MSKRLRIVMEVHPLLSNLPFEERLCKMAESEGMNKAVGVVGQLYRIAYGKEEFSKRVREEWSSYFASGTAETYWLRDAVRDASLVSVRIEPYTIDTIKITILPKRSRKELMRVEIVFYTDGRLGVSSSSGYYRRD